MAATTTRDEDPEFDRDDPDAHVFSRPDGTPTHPQLLSDAFKKLVARSGLPPIRFHDLRHTHATLLLKAGVPIKVVSERLGHSTPGFTMATYQHVIPGMQARSRPHLRSTAPRRSLMGDDSGVGRASPPTSTR